MKQMRSEFAEKFNYDEEALGYDQDVRNEAHPIRAGYTGLLNWVAQQAAAAGSGPILELGSGTGNLTRHLPPEAPVTCVDVSGEMMGIAQEKLPADRPITYVQEDILAFFNRRRGPYAAVVSTYTIHHLTEEEKELLFEKIVAVLRPSGKAILGDLMFEDEEAKTAYLSMCRAGGQEALAEEIEDEFFWNLKTAVKKLQALDFAVQTRQFSDLSWGISAHRLDKS